MPKNVGPQWLPQAGSLGRESVAVLDLLTVRPLVVFAVPVLAKFSEVKAAC